MTCEALPRPDKRYSEPDNYVPAPVFRPVSWEEAQELYPTLSPGEAMEQAMLGRLDGTWRTWLRSDGPSFTFITQSKNLGWGPNYGTMFRGITGRKPEE